VEAPANHVPAAAVIHEVRALFVMTGRKEHQGCPYKSFVKSQRTSLLHANYTIGLECGRG
jgi:hypothetical protein